MLMIVEGDKHFLSAMGTDLTLEHTHLPPPQCDPFDPRRLTMMEVDTPPTTPEIDTNLIKLLNFQFKCIHKILFKCKKSNLFKK